MSTILRLVCLVVLLTLMQQCWRTAGQTAYNEDQLKLYAKLCQQLRNEINEKGTALMERLGTLRQRRYDVLAEITNDQDTALEVLKDSRSRAEDIGSFMKRIYTPAVKVAPPHPYTDKYQPILTNVIVDHGMGYRGNDGTITFTKGGIYSMEYKMQTSMSYSYYSTVKVLGGDGQNKYNFEYYIGSSVTPFFEMMIIEVGDMLIVESLDDSSAWWSNSNAIATDTFPKTWLVIRFLGQTSAATTSENTEGTS